MHGCVITAGRCKYSVTKDDSITWVWKNISAESSDVNIMHKVKPLKDTLTGQSNSSTIYAISQK
jgi:hypothetical protein